MIDAKIVDLGNVFAVVVTVPKTLAKTMDVKERYGDREAKVVYDPYSGNAELLFLVHKRDNQQSDVEHE